MRKSAICSVWAVMLAVCWPAMAAPPGFFQDLVEPYEFPIEDPYAATVVGTPPELKVELPASIPIRERRHDARKGVEVPNVFWYDRRFNWSFVTQDDAAPLIFLIAGTGASHRSAKMQFMQKAFYEAGFHVISISSPTFPNFLVSASSTHVPGHIVHDSEDIYQVMQVLYESISDDIEVTDFHVTGYSLGGMQSVFVAAVDERERYFNFKRVLAINPPLSLYSSVSTLDYMLDVNLPPQPQALNKFFNDLFEAFSRVYQRSDSVSFGDDFLYRAWEERVSPDDQVQTELQRLIGLSFRLSSTSMIFASDVMTNAGYIKPRNVRLTTGTSTTDFYKVAMRIGFTNYFDEFFLPFYRQRDPDLTRQQLIELSSLISMEDFIARNPQVAMMHNDDDIILAPGEIDYLRKVFQGRSRIYPYGGHCGNMDHRDNAAAMVAYFLH